jgi:hypothetical protein
MQYILWGSLPFQQTESFSVAPAGMTFANARSCAAISHGYVVLLLEVISDRSILPWRRSDSPRPPSGKGPALGPVA